MMKFDGIQKTLTYTQLNKANIADVFPLLCPVREKDWLEGWDFKMIHSVSGLIEKDCVFTTAHHGKFETVWQVTQYDTEKYLIEFLRVTPEENIVKINIHLKELGSSKTEVVIDYQFTSLCEAQNNFIDEELHSSFNASMQWWEKAINHYLLKGEMLRKS
jgi:hypothetical protein